MVSKATSNNGMHPTPATLPLMNLEKGAGDAERYAATLLAIS